MRLALLILFVLPSVASAQKLHIVALGVDVDHKGNKPDPWGVGARNVANIFAKHSHLKVNKHVFVGKDATRDNLLSTIGNLNAEAKDIVIVYANMHGGLGHAGNFHMSTSGRSTSGKELAGAINKLPCGVFLIMDTCHAGGMLDYPMPKASVLCACRKDETAYGNNLIVSIRKGASGEADSNRDGNITIQELMSYVPGKCAQVSHGSQHPVFR